MPAYPIITRETPGGERRAPPLDIDVALITPFTFDAHIVQYEGGTRRNKSDVSPDNPLLLSIELYDFDRKDAPPGWADECLARLPAGFVGYRTAGGFRALTLRETPFVVRDAETWEDWRAYHGGRAEALGAIIGAAPDHATDEPNRLFRLPNVRRADGKPCFPAIVGELGFSALEPAPWERRAATEHAPDGSASRSMIGAVFAAAGRVLGEQGSKLIVDCPWSHEHTTPGGTFVDDTPDHYGHFVCGHSHCKAAGRGSPQALEALRALPAVQAELEHWPDPGVGEWTRSANPAESLSPPSADASGADDPAPPKKPAGMFELMSAEDIDVEEPIPWVIKDLVSVGEPTLIVGGAGSGKTSAMVELALSVATGRDVWGMFPVARSGPVVHIDYEQGKTLRRTYRAFAAGLGLNAAELVREGKLRIAPLPREQLLDANVTDKHLSAVGKELVALTRGAVLCIVNSLTAGTNKVNENDAKIAAVFNLFCRVTEITGCAFVVLHHSGRSEGKTRARGSSAIDGAVQTVFEISHRKGQMHTTWTHVKDRPAGGTLDPFKLVWSGPGDVQTLHAEAPQEETPEPALERPEDRMQRAILWVMVNKGHSVKQRILECVRGKMTAKRSVWDDMLVRGLIEHVGSRYLVAPGVVAPKEEPDGVRDEED